MGEFFDIYKKNKNPPNSYLCASCCYESNVHEVVWFVEIYKALQAM